MTLTNEEKEIIEMIDMPLQTLSLGYNNPLSNEIRDAQTHYIGSVSSLGRLLDEKEQHELAHMLVKAFNHYYAAPSEDVVVEADRYVKKCFPTSGIYDEHPYPISHGQAKIQCKAHYLAGASRPVSQWVSVETPPNDNRWVLVCNNAPYASVIPHCWMNGKWHTYTNCAIEVNITHWRDYPKKYKI